MENKLHAQCFSRHLCVTYSRTFRNGICESNDSLCMFQTDNILLATITELKRKQPLALTWLTLQHAIVHEVNVNTQYITNCILGEFCHIDWHIVCK